MARHELRRMGRANGALQVAESFRRAGSTSRGQTGAMREGAADVYRHRRDVAALPGACAEHGAAYGRRMVRCAADAPMATGFTFPQALVLAVGLAALARWMRCTSADAR
ncbi:MAG: hypothetical protein ACLS7Z_03425 [Christensenellales bacterium]